MSMQPSWSIPEFTAADRFRKAREKLGLGQREFAALIGVDKNTISAYETGATSRPRKIVVNAWSMATGVPVEWLLHGVVPPTSPDGDGTQAGETPICSDSSAHRSARVVPLRSASPLAA